MSNLLYPSLQKRHRKTPPLRGYRLDDKTEVELSQIIRIKRSDFFMITVHVAIVIVIVISLLSTLVSNTSVAPYVTSFLWAIPLIFFLISQGYYATAGMFNTLFWVGLVIEILMFLYLGWVIFFNIIACGKAMCYSWSTLVVYALIAFLNFIVWLAYLKVLVTLYQIGALFTRLIDDYSTYRISGKIDSDVKTTKKTAKLFYKTTNVENDK